MGRELSTIVRDLPVDLDLEAARLGDYDRETVIRLFREYEFRTLIERLPAMTGETAGENAEALRRSSTSGTVPAARVAGAARPAGWGSGRPMRPPVGGGGLQLSLDFDTVAGPVGDPGEAGRLMAGPQRTGRRRRASRAARRRSAERARGRDRRPGTDRGRRRRPGRRASGRGWRRSRRSASRSSFDDPRPRRGTPLAFAVAGRGRARRRREGAEAADRAAPHARRAPGTPLVGHEVKPILVAAASRDDAGAPDDCPSSSTPRSPRTSSTRPCAASRSPTSSPSGSTSILPPAEELAPRPAPASRRCRRSPSATRSRARSRRRASSACSARSSCRSSRSSPAWRRTASRSTSRRSGVLDREFAAEIARLEAEIYAAVGHQFNLGRPSSSAGPVLRAGPAEGQADQDRLLDRRLGARGAAPGPPDDRQAPRLADLHEAPLDLRRGAADAASPPTAGCTRRSTRPSPRPGACRRPTRTSRTSRSGRRSGGGSGGRSWPAPRT